MNGMERTERMGQRKGGGGGGGGGGERVGRGVRRGEGEMEAR